MNWRKVAEQLHERADWIAANTWQLDDPRKPAGHMCRYLAQALEAGLDEPRKDSDAAA